MPLARGARLGPYRVDHEIGAGGMGHVFRATDTRLDRAVAIKVLPQHRWADAKVKHRFEREARALSSVSHPNLCALYDVGEITESGSPVPYLVMELLEGESLRDRLQTGRIGVRKALTWAAQVASGLAAAHAKGVIHRDLKPDNIFITGGHLLKILDFGLALQTETTDTSATSMRTDPGLIMGTSHYMSPEQVRGEPLDPRSDIFSLGIVLFEMLTGEVPFHARSSVETMNAILTEDPPELSSLVTGVPDVVEELVRRCLEKEPSARFSSAHDLAFALESAAKQVTPATPTPARRRTVETPVQNARPNRTGTIVISALALALIVAAILSRNSSSDAPQEPPRLRMLTYSGRDSAPAASPDGRLIAYVSSRDGRRRIWLKQLGDGTEAAITAGPDDSAPRFSADGASVVFTRAGNALYRVATVGGEPRKLIDNAADADWSPDGKQLAFIRGRATPARVATVCIASIDGGEAKEILATTTEELSAPRWSPDGKSIAVTRAPRGTTAGSLLVIDLVSGDKRVLSRKEPHGLISGAAWTRDGSALIYVELEALASAGLPRRRGSSVIVRHEVESGDARILLRNPHSAADTVDIAGDGRLVFSEDLTRQSLQEVTLDGSRAPRWLSRGMSVDRQPSYTRDGKSVIFASDRGGNVDLWQLRLEDNSVHRLTEHASIDWDPHPASDALFWSSNRGGHFEVWTASLDGANPRQVTRDGIDAENPSLPAHGEWLIYDSSNPASDGIWRIPRNGGTPTLVVAGETIHPIVSADGEYVAYQRPEPEGTAALDVARVADGKVFTLLRRISGPTLLRPHWIGATHTIAFRDVDASGTVSLFAQDFRPEEDTRTTRRQLIASNPDAAPDTFGISADGKRAIVAVLDEASGVMLAEEVR